MKREKNALRKGGYASRIKAVSILASVLATTALLVLAAIPPFAAAPKKPKPTHPGITFDVAFQAGTVQFAVLTEGFCAYGTGPSNFGSVGGRMPFDCIRHNLDSSGDPLGGGAPAVCPTDGQTYPDGITLCQGVHGGEVDETGQIVSYSFSFAERVVLSEKKSVRIQWVSDSMPVCGTTPPCFSVIDPDSDLTTGFTVVFNVEVTLHLNVKKGLKLPGPRPDSIFINIGVIIHRPISP